MLCLANVKADISNKLNIEKIPNNLHNHLNDFLLQGLLVAQSVAELRWTGQEWVGLELIGP